MTGPLVECVPNFSEGRDRQKVDAIAESIASAGGVSVLDVTLDPDHNRSVITFAGQPEAAVEAAIRAAARAVEAIDLTRQSGVHPRIGAADVVPFIPARDISLQACAGLATMAGEQIWRRLGVPVYLYEAAARRPERVNLENVRRGGFEGLREAVRTDPSRLPDFGEAELHPTAGAVAVGARKFLIAFNINLRTPDVRIARAIAGQIRTSSGGLPFVKAMGVSLASRNLAQVSMNLTDFERTPVHQVFTEVRDRAASQGVGIAGCELIGLIPEKALERSGEWLPLVEDFHPDRIFENRIR
ncbi:MAG TPA: glutamate formimidoyltransferase [Bryobacteraceae bacterium]|nr:glutamate formimidoyltransferase [Bryobacteraceae bacterium]